jgi:c-di-GMP-binding flagellar brake protein YcgR
MASNYSFAKKEKEFKEEPNVPMMSILVHSRTVMEKKDYVSTGILTYAEGDMLEVEIGDYFLFELGDLVKVTIYTPVGIFMFNTTVIAKDDGSLIMINPPENRKKFSEKRMHTRIDLQRKGMMTGIYPQGGPAKQPFVKPLECFIKNLSQNGIGFTIESLKLTVGEYIEISLNFGMSLVCKAEIMRVDEVESEIYYGAELINISPEQMMALRAFILKLQVEQHVNRKKIEKTDAKKRVFK